VAQVQVWLAAIRVRIQLDPNALATRGIALTEVEQAVGNSNVNLPTGRFWARQGNVDPGDRPAHDCAGLCADHRRYRNGARCG
jgi:multidrug efflux pump subunit AcrB